MLSIPLVRSENDTRAPLVFVFDTIRNALTDPMIQGKQTQDAAQAAIQWADLFPHTERLDLLSLSVQKALIDAPYKKDALDRFISEVNLLPDTKKQIIFLMRVLPCAIDDKKAWETVEDLLLLKSCSLSMKAKDAEDRDLAREAFLLTASYASTFKKESDAAKEFIKKVNEIRSPTQRVKILKEEHRNARVYRPLEHCIAKALIDEGTFIPFEKQRDTFFNGLLTEARKNSHLKRILEERRCQEEPRHPLATLTNKTENPACLCR